MEIHLPEVPLVKIFSSLDGFSLLQAAQVSKSWNAVADTEILWRRLCLRKWYFNDVTREHLCTQMWPHLGAQTWKQFFLRRTKRERCMERARPEDFVYREIPGGLDDFGIVKYLSKSDLTMDGQGKSILCTVSEKGRLSTWDVQQGVMMWASPLQQRSIIKLVTLPEMQLAVTVDFESTIKVWNCHDRDALAAVNMPRECFTLKTLLTKDGSFLLVGDSEGHIYTFMLPMLQYLSTVKAFECPVQLLYCSLRIDGSSHVRCVKTSYQRKSSASEQLICLVVPVDCAPEKKAFRQKVETSPGCAGTLLQSQNWVDSWVEGEESCSKKIAVFLTDCFLRPSEYSSPLYVCLPFPLCYGACWTPRRENRITLMYLRGTHRFTGFTTFDLSLERTGNKEIIEAQQIANFLLPTHLCYPMKMGISDGNVIVFGSGPCLFLYTIDGLQLHRFDDHQRDIDTLWMDSLHVLSTSEDGSLHVYMWDEGGRHLKKCCQLEYLRMSLPPHCYAYYTKCDNVSIVRVVSRESNSSILQIYALNTYTLKTY